LAGAVLAFIGMPFTLVPDEARSDDTFVVSVRGKLAEGADRALAEAFLQVPGNGRIVLDLDSPGGYADPVFRMIEVIRTAKIAHRIDTYVASGARCESMCVELFMAGDRRRAGRASVWGFHAVNDNGKRNDLYTGIYVDDLVRRGADPSWLERKGLFRDAHMITFTGQELFDDASGIVTDLS
jgi:hypothetical protein